MAEFRNADRLDSRFVAYRPKLKVKQAKYKLKDPMGKTVGKYTTVKGARKKGYDLQDGIYSRYDVFTYGGSFVGYIDYRYRGHRQVVWHEKGEVYYVLADGSVSRIF